MREPLIRYIRRSPRTTQQCRDELHRLSEGKVSHIETEGLLAELRDEGEIAFANGRWYEPEGYRTPAKPRTSKPVHPKQLPLFGPRLTAHEAMMQRIGDVVRAVRGQR